MGRTPLPERPKGCFAQRGPSDFFRASHSHSRTLARSLSGSLASTTLRTSLG
jgi:hypothetical protein